MNKSHLTAMTRKTLSAPMEWLNSQELFCDVPPRLRLDYGCGKGKDADLLEFVKYDPFYFPHFPTEKFELITCNYVLNTLPDEAERQSVLDKIMELLLPQGEAYISVRADRKNLNGYTRKGTYQTFIELSVPWRLIDSTSSYHLYTRSK